MMRVLRRQMARDLSLLLIAVVTAGVVALTVGWPRALDRLVRDDLVAQTAALPTTQRDLVVTTPTNLNMVGITSVGDEAQALLDRAARWADDQISDAGPALRSVLGTPQYEITRSPFYIERGDNAPTISFMTLTLSAGPRAKDLRLVEGSWPTVPDTSPWTQPSGPPAPIVLDVVLSRETARWMGWKVGEERASLGLPTAPLVMRLTGLVEPRDPSSGVWAHLPGRIEPSVDRDDNAGWTVNGIGFVNPLAIGVLVIPSGTSLTAWYPVDATAVGETDRQALATELDRVRASAGLRSEVSTVLAAEGGREHAASTLLAVLVAGLVGVAAGVLWLVSVLAVERRRAALVLLRRRGASSLRLAALVGAQAAAAALPGAAIGYLIGMRVPGRTDPTDLVLPAALTLGAVSLMVIAGARVHGGRARRVARFRWVGELLVLAVTGFALTATSGSDPLVVALPLLAGLSAAIVALRVYPWPARLALRISTRRDLGAFLGLARAARTPAAGLVPALALTLGLATAGLGTTTVATVQQATATSATRAVGGDLRLDLGWSPSGVGLSDAQIAAARDVPGVADVATVADAGTVTLRQGRSQQVIHLRVVDGAALARVQAGLHEGVTDLTSGGRAAIVTPGLPSGAVTLDAPLGKLALTARTVEDVPGVTVGAQWMVVDRETWAAVGGTPPVDRLLVRLDPGADPDTVATAMISATGATLLVTTRAKAEGTISDSVLVRGVRTGMLAVAAAGLALVAAVLALMLVAEAPSRSRTAALLATVGAPSRVNRRLVVSEVLGPVLVGGAAGVLAGAVLPTVVLRLVDLRPFTGAAERPPLALDPVLLAAAGGGLALVVLLGVGIAAATARRRSPVAVLREGAAG